MIWLGSTRGYLTDWTTQQWVRLTGRKVSLGEDAWLDGPCGCTVVIGKDFFATYAQQERLETVETGVRGLLLDFRALEVGNDGLANVDPRVKAFYEQTSEYELDAWSEWHGFFRPFGSLLGLLFSRRLQQLNVPLSSMDSSRGMTSKVTPLRDPETGLARQAAWTRELLATGNVIYAGCYSVTHIPGHAGACVKVVFPLPNGNGIVIMKALCKDGMLRLQSMGRCFGQPGFYFTVLDSRPNGADAPRPGRARYVASLKEQIDVYAAEAGTVRADHTLWIWGFQFLRLHYRMRRRA